jgi:hypothetical protein
LSLLVVLLVELFLELLLLLSSSEDSLTLGVLENWLDAC